MRSILASTLPNLLTLSALPGQVSEAHYFVSGEVHVEAGAGIGAGVLLRANPGCRIQIGRGVCIGMGSILHAHGGSLIIEAGATLGTGVLIIGQGTIGRHACIGSETTLLDCSILSQQVIPPGSLIGDPTYVDPTHIEAANAGDTQTEPGEATAAPEPTPPPPPNSPVANVEKQTRLWQESAQQAQEKPRSKKIRKLNGIPGHSELDRLLGKIYPHRQALSSNDG